ncbi:MAG: glycosyltransferase family 9 protein [Chloroflexota bacterium]
MDESRDREWLAKRNRSLTAFQHQLTWREKARRQLLQAYTWLPKPLRQKPIRGTILLIRPDHLGDILLTTPAVRALKAAEPSSRLIALAGVWSAEALAAYSQIDMVLTLPFPGFTRQPKESIYRPYIMAWRWAHQVRLLRAETAIILRPDHWWGALLAYIAGVPRRIGYDMPDVRPFLTERVPYVQNHTVLQNLKLVEDWTGPLDRDQIDYSFPIMEEDRTYIGDLLTASNVAADRPVVVIHAGAGTPIKRWTVEHWATVADRLATRLDATIVFTGGDREHAQIWQVMDKMHHTGVSLAGDTNISQLAALYERAAVVLGADSGPLHLAVASGAPTVHLYGPADPAEFGPWGDPQRQIVVTSNIGCRPCRVLDWPGDDPANHPCIRDIKPQQVIEMAMQAARRR